MRPPYTRAAAVLAVMVCIDVWSGLSAQTVSSPRIVIGTLDGDPMSAFGWIIDVEADASGNIYVVDWQSPEIRWFKPTGEYAGTIGRAGQGPGEFVAPRDIAIDADENLHIVDAGSGRISTYSVADGTPRFVSDHRLPLPGLSICALGTRRYVLAQGLSAILHEVGADGTLVRSFGEPVEATGELRRAMAGQPVFQLSNGALACDAASERVVFVSQLTGEVRAYSRSGDEIWRDSIAGMRRVDLRVVERLGQCCAYAPNRATNTVQSAMRAMVERGNLVVSLSETHYGEDWQRHPGSQWYEVRMLRLTDGMEVSMIPAEMIVSGFIDGRPYGFIQEPFPQVLVY